MGSCWFESKLVIIQVNFDFLIFGYSKLIVGPNSIRKKGKTLFCAT